jgi:4-hydroxy-2-oxoglutarate aldolase
MLTLQGIIPPVPTPFTKQGDVDTGTLQALLRRLEPNVDGFLILGSNGEAAFLSEAERRQVFEAARAVIPANKPMLVGTGGEATQLVAARNQEAFEIGADAALVLPPHYYVSAMTEGVLKTHYRTLAEQSPLPVMLYNFPAVTTLAFSPGLIAELAQHGNIVGMKDSSGNVAALTETLRQVPADFQVMTGSASTFLAALSLGVRGGILAVANVAARPYRRLLDAFNAGDLETVRALQLSLNPLAQAVTARFGVPGLKAVMRLQGIDAGYPRAPLTELSDTAALEPLLQNLERAAA